MSLTSYRAAPPRVVGVSGPRLVPGWRSTIRLATFAGVSRQLRYRAAPPRGGTGCGWTMVGLGLWVGRSGGPGGDLLCRALRRSTIGAEGFHGRVRDGIGCFAPRYGHQAGQTAWQKADIRSQKSE